MKTMTTDAKGQTSGLVFTRCPVCRQTTELHSESIYVGAEVLCHVCSAILRVEEISPLRVIEIEDDEVA